MLKMDPITYMKYQPKPIPFFKEPCKFQVKSIGRKPKIEIMATKKCGFPSLQHTSAQNTSKFTMKHQDRPTHL